MNLLSTRNAKNRLRKNDVTSRDEKITIRESSCGSLPPREVGWGGIWGWFLENMLVKKCVFLNVFGEEWARRGSSGRETSAKLTAMAFSSLIFFMVRGQKITKNVSKTPDPLPQAADMLTHREA